MRVRIRYVSYVRRNKKLLAVSVSLFVLFIILIKLFMAHTTAHKCPNEPIDVVYTWVNGSDERFLSDLKSYIQSSESTSQSFDASQQRFCDKYELKFSLRSLERYAPWVNHIYIVTNGQIPYWLDLDYPKVTLVTHKDIFPYSKYDLPTFSSPAIEAHLHRIAGLSKRFIYMNDDVFFGAPVYLDDFVSDSRGFLVYLAWPVPPCSADCPWLYVRDGQCDEQCLTDSCQNDGGDCDSTDKLHYHSEAVEVEASAPPTVKYLYEIERERQSRINLTKLLTANSTTNNSLADVVHRINREFILIDKLTRKIKKQTKHLRKPNATTPAPQMQDSTTFDAFSESLQYCNRLFNARYGFKTRYVAAHAPILIDTVIMTSLQTDFAAEFALTSHHKLRTGTDLQYAFTYYNYFMTQTRYFDSAHIFDTFDTDSSGTWSDREIRTVLTRLYDLPLDYGAVDHFETVLLNCSTAREFAEVSTPLYERYVDSTLPTISKEMIISCPALIIPLRTAMGAHKRPRYHYTILRGSDTTDGSTEHPVTFKMLSSNLTSVINALDHIRRKPTKFVCINDNLDPAKAEDNDLIVSVLYDFYLSLFPLASKFELAADLRNRFQHVDELARWRHRNLIVKLTLSLCFILLLCTLVMKKCRYSFLKLLAVTVNKVV